MLQESNKKKGQISIEFMIVFAFILVVFLFLFALITQQRAITQNSQTFSQLQLVAQTIALQINRASQAGPGFSAQLPITTSIGNIPYNVSVTKAGVVIIAATSGTQIMRATAYSNVQSVTSSTSFYGLGNTLYVLPIANGTISLQNSFGTICIDYQCPTNANVSGSISLSSQVTHVANLNGQNSYVTVPNSVTLNFERTNPFSISFWMKGNNTGVFEMYLSKGDINTPGYSVYSNTDNHLEFQIYSSAGSQIFASDRPAPNIRDGLWHYIAVTYDGSSSISGTNIYVDGSSRSVTNIANTLTTSILNAQNVIIGGEPTGAKFRGQLSNVQIYSSSLTQVQVLRLYQAGIQGSPITANIAGWWPLNGDTNDYSGNGNNGVGNGPVLFTTAAQLFAAVKNPLGQAVNNVLVGFETTLGNFSNGAGSGQGQSSYTNPNGVASVFLNQRGNNGQALVKATTLNSNALPQLLLTTWYPLNLGQGSIAHDVSGNQNNGVFGGQISWNLPNYYAQFPSPQTSGIPPASGISGQTSYVEQKTGFVFMDSAAQPFTISLWVRPNATSGVILSELGQPTPNTNWHDSWLELVNGNVYMRIWSSGCQLLGKINTNTWTNIAMTYNGAVLTGYINGASTNVVSYTRQVPVGGTTAMFYPLGTPDLQNCGSGLSYSGGIANYQFYSNSLSQLQIASLYAAGLSSSPIPGQNAQLWYPLAGDTNDYSGNSYNASMYGGASFAPLVTSIPKQQLSNGNRGKTLIASFNGGNYNSLSSTINLQSFNAISVIGWINTTSNNEMIFQLQPPGSTLIYLEVGATTAGGNANQFVTYIRNNNPGSGIIPWNSNIVVNNNAWHQVGLTWNGTIANMYVDGMLASQAAFNGVLASSPYNLGGSGASSYIFNGLMSNFQIYNTSIAAQQVSQLYSLGLSGTPPNTAGLAAWYPLQGNSNDYSTNSRNMTAANVIFKNSINYAPYLLQANNYSGIYFNGQNSYVQANYILSYDRNVPFSIAFWMNTKVTGQDGFLIGDANGLGAVSAGFEAWLWHGAKCVIWRFEDTSGNVYGPGCTTNVEDGNWHYVVVTFDGSSNQAGMKLYVDGKLDGTAGSLAIASSINPYPSQYNSFLALGAGNINHNYPYTGSLSNVQVFSAALTLAQVQQLYNTQPAPSSSIVVPLSWSP